MEKKTRRLPEFAVIGLLLLNVVVVIFIGNRGNNFAIYVKNTFLSAGSKDGCSRHTKTHHDHDKLLGGLLSPKFDNQSCFGRYKSSMYRKPSPFPVSPFLIEKLRTYEERHTKCGPNSDPYKQAIDRLMNSGKIKSAENAGECKYVIWTQMNGLGNRMLSLVSTFLYAVLTNRVLLVEFRNEMRDLFCEPFRDSTWHLPPDFPIKDLLWKYNNESPESYASMLKNGNITGDFNIPALVFFNAVSTNWRMENYIFCDDHQRILKRFDWMVVKSDGYFATALFLLPMYRNELNRLFPVKESVFHHLGRYLFQPANPVWNIIDRFYRTNLINSDKKIGLQIRIFQKDDEKTFEEMYDRVIACSDQANLMPKLEPTTNHSNSSQIITDNRTSILVFSLISEFYERLKAMYYENSTANGELVSVHQPTHEREQDSRTKSHNQKALAEMFLLSYCDEIVTTPTSTFGYVAHGFAGLRPWILRTLRPWMQAPGPACVRSDSVEPCLHSPPILECKANASVDPREVVSYVRQCDDAPMGVKLYDLV